jgi:hypothetical protein
LAADSHHASPRIGRSVQRKHVLGRVTLFVEVPPGARSRHVLCAELTRGYRRFGEIAEALIDVG